MVLVWLRGPAWNPPVRTWSCGSTIEPLLGIPYSEELGALLRGRVFTPHANGDSLGSISSTTKNKIKKRLASQDGQGEGTEGWNSNPVEFWGELTL